MKKLIMISQEDLDYVNKEARKVSDPRAVTPNFSKGLHKIIGEHRNGTKSKI